MTLRTPACVAGRMVMPLPRNRSQEEERTSARQRLCSCRGHACRLVTGHTLSVGWGTFCERWACGKGTRLPQPLVRRRGGCRAGPSFCQPGQAPSGTALTSRDMVTGECGLVSLQASHLGPGASEKGPSRAAGAKAGETWGLAPAWGRAGPEGLWAWWLAPHFVRTGRGCLTFSRSSSPCPSE